MVDNLPDLVNRAWISTNSDNNNVNNTASISHSLHPHSFFRKTSDNSNNHNSNNNLHQHVNRQFIQSPLKIVITNHDDSSSLRHEAASKILSNHRTVDSGHVTDGEIGSLRLSSKRPTASLVRWSSIQSVHDIPRQTSPTVNHLSAIEKSHGNEDEESSHDDNAHRRRVHHSRPSRKASPIKRHDKHNTHSPTTSHHNPLPVTPPSRRRLRLILVRHGERANQVLGSDWFSKAFRENTYRPYHRSLPSALPKRDLNQAYEYDVPLTVHGLKSSRGTGRAMLNANLIADLCLSSNALRCIQTCERILSGMKLRDRVSIHIEPGLFECPHFNYKVVDSFMTKQELIENGYNIKSQYQPVIEKVNVPESLDEYFDRCVTVMHGIIERYGHRGGTVLIVTHAPGLLALTDAVKGIRSNHNGFYRTVATYPPLATYVIEYDGTKWKHSEQPFSFALSEK